MADHDPHHPPCGPAGAPEPGQAWVTHDEEDVSPFAITGGRTHPQHWMRLASQLEADDTTRVGSLAPEAARAVELCRHRPYSVAEIASRLGLHITVTKVMLSDAINSGALRMAVPSQEAPDPLQLLEALRSGLKQRLSDVA